MALAYVITAKKNPRKPDDPVKYYLLARKLGTLNFEDLLVRATEDTTLDPDELRMSLNRAFLKAEEYLSEGFTVNFGHLGHIQLAISGEGADSPGECKPSLMKRIRARFVFSQAFQQVFQKIGLKEFPEI